MKKGEWLRKIVLKLFTFIVVPAILALRKHRDFTGVIVPVFIVFMHWQKHMVLYTYGKLITRSYDFPCVQDLVVLQIINSKH